MPSKPTVASLFAGAGGMDIGFHQAGFDIVWANDIDSDACQTHRNWSSADVVCGDVKSLSTSQMPSVDVIAGGWPCQGFSISGPRKVDDSRNILYRHFVRCVEEKQPKAFVAENVKGLLTLGEGSIIKTIVAEFSDKGYDVSFELLNASDYLVPQERQRVIIVGIRKDIGSSFEFPEMYSTVVSMRDVLGNLPEPNQEDVCLAPYSSRYMSRNRHRDWERPSFTIPAMAKQCPLHPSSPDMIYVSKDVWKFGEGGSRRLSWIEAALIQTFPAGMEFCGDLISKYKQIGNAVPVKLAEVIAKQLLKTLGENYG
jgi:DNA (cytosine-5)-methyltransferase 1